MASSNNNYPGARDPDYPIDPRQLVGASGAFGGYVGYPGAQGAGAGAGRGETGVAGQFPGGSQGQQGGAGQGVQHDVTSQLLPPYVPHVDVVDGGDELVVRIDAPGFDEEDIQLTASGQVLVVEATRNTGPDEGEQSLSVERPTQLRRVVQLPVTIDVEEATAEHDNGVCTVRIPKRDGSMDDRIPFR